MGCNSSIRTARRVLAVLPLVPVVAVAAIVLVALTPSGAWLDVTQDGEASVTVDGAYLEAEVPVRIDSHMPYTLEGLSVDLALFDGQRGSYQTLVTSDPVDVPGNGSGTMVLRSSVFAPTLYLIMGDLVHRDGSVLWFDVTAECGYLLGLADFRLTATVSVPLAAEGETVGYDVVENSNSAFRAVVTGLAPSLVPEDSTYSITGGGAEVDISLTAENGVLTISVTSPAGLDQAIDSITGSDDASVNGPDGRLDVDPEDVATFIEVLDFVRGTV